ncbi:MAG: 50S ribosomal protein L3 [Nanoarchaeota archaeon]|nr:50S ribosomal protein L3 [Nanoarchaeota archaeon]MBU1004855.1 50S ribosomal protein L3 [Nanoarchaeota archaeon]MBU1946333.1 50S ribosomal protein L3 [Nanoarchaeota archaeon]
MPTVRRPRFGSMAYYPRKRTKKPVASIGCWAKTKEAKLLGFAGYKVGMAHVMLLDNGPNSMTKGKIISYPVTLIECPPLKVASVRFYKKTGDGLKVVSDVFADELDKELERKIIFPKNKKIKIDDIKDFDDIQLTVYTQPKLTTIGKKRPELFEMGIGGKKEEKLAYAKSVLGKIINVSDIFKEGAQLDIHAITKGKGLQGPVKRFGISLRSHKSEKSRRNPGSLGGWQGQGKVMWRVPHAGQMGYYQRLEHNKWLLKISDKPEEVNPKSGFLRYGLIKNPYIIIKGSAPGPTKRLIRFNTAIRPSKFIQKEAPQIKEILT